MHSFSLRIAVSATRDSKLVMRPVIPPVALHHHGYHRAVVCDTGSPSQRQLAFQACKEPPEILILLPARQLEPGQTTGDLRVGMDRRQRIARAQHDDSRI